MATRKKSSRSSEERHESKKTERRERKTGKEVKPKRKATAKAVPKRRVAQEKKSIAKRAKKGEFTPVKRPGAATEQAKKEGLSVDAWARKHQHDPGRKGKQARFVLISKKWHHGAKKKKSA